MWLVILMMTESGKLICKDVFIHAKSTNKEVRKVLESKNVVKHQLMYWFITERQAINSTKTEKVVFMQGTIIPQGDDPVRKGKVKDE